MAVVGEKLYPPYIEGTIAAFYSEKNEDGTWGAAEIAVPFSFNKAVSPSDVSGFVLKIRRVQSGTYLTPIEVTDPQKVAEFCNTGVAKFTWADPQGLAANNESASIDIGDYVKLQLAFISASTGSVGYFSTVGISKYTAPPEVFIKDMKTETYDSLYENNTFKYTYYGIAQNTDDITEKTYSFNFTLYNHSKELIESSGWLLHNSALMRELNVNNTLYESLDTYTFKTSLVADTFYYIQYGVRTINGLEIYSPMYSCIEVEGLQSELKANFKATNVFEEGYVKLTLEPFNLNKNSAQGNFIICRALESENFLYWQPIHRFTFYSSQPLTSWYFKDYTVEQGVTYQYSIQQYNDRGLRSQKIISNSIIADFEDIFLYDGERQLKIRYNPKIASFKIDRLEQKIDTIGSQYPHFFKNGKVEYREFPISGLISYLEDNAQEFMTYSELGLEPDTRTRGMTPTYGLIEEYNYPTTSYEAYSVRAERLFKMKVLEWMGNGKPKLFKSSTEGNYIVRLMNCSLAPDDKLSRLIHTFTGTAYEIDDFNYETLTAHGFINSEEGENSTFTYVTIPFVDIAYGNFISGQINNQVIAGEFFIEDAIPGTVIHVDGMPLKIGVNGALRVKMDKDIEKVVIQTSPAIGQITCRYRITGKSYNSFSYVTDVSVRDEATSFIGPYDVGAYITSNCKRQISHLLSLEFKEKRIIKCFATIDNLETDGNGRIYYQDGAGLYTEQNSLYLDNELTKDIPIKKLDEENVYEIYLSTNGELTTYEKSLLKPEMTNADYQNFYNHSVIVMNDKYGIDKDNFIALSYEEKIKFLNNFNPFLCYYINGKFYDKIDKGITINGETSIGEPHVTMPTDNAVYDSIIIGNGIICNIAFTIKRIYYSIEDTDMELISLRNSLGSKYVDNDIYINLLQSKLDKITGGD